MLRYPFSRSASSSWRELERIQREMNRLFSDYAGSGVRRAAGFPAMNVWNSPEDVVVTAELPGFDADDIDISVVGDTLTLSGKRDPDETGENVRYHRRERGCGRFTRSFQLPFLVDSAKVEATFDKGVLHIHLPRAEEDKPKKIAIKSA